MSINDKEAISMSKPQYERFKQGVEQLVYKYVTRERSTVISLIAHNVNQGADSKKLEHKLSSYVDQKLSLKLIEKAYHLVEKVKTTPKATTLPLPSSKPSKRSHRDKEEDDIKRGSKPSKRVKLKEDDNGPTNRESKESRNSSSIPNSPERKSVVTTAGEEVQIPMEDKQIKDIMAKAQAAIEERKRAMSIQPTANGAGYLVPPPIVIASPALMANSSSAMSQRIAELQARIKSQLTTAEVPMMAMPVPILTIATPITQVSQKAQETGTPPQPKPTPLMLDSEGRTIDIVTGKEVHLEHRIPMLKANIRAKKREEFKQQLQEKPLEDLSENAFFDPRVRPGVGGGRVKRTFRFHEPGKFIQVAQRERAKAKLEKLQSQIAQNAKKTGIASAARLAQLEKRGSGAQDGAIPDVEWWDAVILDDEKYPDKDDVPIVNEYITRLIEHPLEMKAVGPDQIPVKQPAELQVFLTKEERKKMRRMNRREAWKEKQEKIRLGLEPPPEPKVRMANFMRVLGTEAVLDPTKMEKHVREQMAKRLKAHEDANAARKLTPDQRREKKTRKLQEDTVATGVHVAVYRITDLTNGSHKFKVETNAKQLFLTGTVVLLREANVVVVEGGPKQLKRYKRLMLDRIKWKEECRSKDAAMENKCTLVWEGVVAERNFGEMQFKACPTECFARDHFKKLGVEHYWDLAYGKKILEETECGL